MVWMWLPSWRTSGNLSLDSKTNSIDQTGVISIDDGTINLTGGAITLTDDNIFGAITVANGAGDVKITEADTTNGIDIASINRTSGDLTLDGQSSAIDQVGTGVISIDDGALKLTGGAITLTNNNIVGVITVETGNGNISITEADTNGIDIGSIARASGDLTLNSGTAPIDHAVAGTGVISIDDGTVTITGGAITLTNDNILGDITVNTGIGNVSINEADSIAVKAVTRTSGGLTLNAGSKSITQSGVISIADGALELTGGPITLALENIMGGITVNNGIGDISIKETDTGNTNAMDITSIARTSGNLSLDSGTNSIDQTGLILIDDGSLNLTGGAITLTQDNILGAITVNTGTGNVSITEADSTNGMIVASILRTSGNLTLDSKTNSIDQTGVISIDDGILKLTGGAITLEQANVVGAITVEDGSGDVSITEADSIDGIDIASIVRTSGGLNLNSGSNSIDQSGAISIGTGALTLTGGAVTLKQDTNQFENLTINAGLVQIVEANGVQFVGDSSASSLILTLKGGSLTDSLTSSLIVSGNTVLDVDNGAAIILDASNDFGSSSGTLSIAAGGSGNVIINDDNSLTLASGNVAKNLTITTGGKIGPRCY